MPFMYTLCTMLTDPLVTGIQSRLMDQLILMLAIQATYHGHILIYPFYRSIDQRHSPLCPLGRPTDPSHNHICPLNRPIDPTNSHIYPLNMNTVRLMAPYTLLTDLLVLATALYTI